LCIIAAFLFTYRGYDWKDQAAALLAGVGAVGVAWFPYNTMGTLHYSSAAGLFGALIYFAGVLFPKTNASVVLKPKRTRNRIYRSCALVMALAVGSIPLVPGWTFWAESLALWAFGLSWFVKGETLWKDV
jgi:hypothetical protein